MGPRFEPWFAHHPVFRNSLLGVGLGKGRFVGHFSRFVIAVLGSLEAGARLREFFARLSPAAGIPFPAVGWEKTTRRKGAEPECRQADRNWGHEKADCASVSEAQ